MPNIVNSRRIIRTKKSTFPFGIHFLNTLKTGKQKKCLDLSLRTTMYLKVDLKGGLKVLNYCGN